MQGVWESKIALKKIRKKRKKNKQKKEEVKQRLNLLLQTVLNRTDFPWGGTILIMHTLISVTSSTQCILFFNGATFVCEGHLLDSGTDCLI